MIRYLLDTDLSSYFLKRAYPALDLRVRAALEADEVAISAVTRRPALWPGPPARRGNQASHPDRCLPRRDTRA